MLNGSRPRRYHDLAVERRILLGFLAEPRQAIAAVKVKLHDIDPGAIDGALVALLIEGLLIRDGAQEWLLAPAVRHLAALELLNPAAPNGSPPRTPDAATLDRILRRSTEGRRV